MQDSPEFTDDLEFLGNPAFPEKSKSQIASKSQEHYAKAYASDIKALENQAKT